MNSEHLQIIKREFPDYDASGLPDLSPMVCEAWHNDICPRFRYYTPRHIAELWTDFADPSERELGGPRFSLYVYTTDDGETETGTAAQYEWEELPQDVGAFVLARLGELEK